MQNEKLKVISAMIKRLRAENAQLREEIAALRGEVTEMQKRIDAEDQEAFDLVHRKNNRVSAGCIHILLK